MKDLVSIIKVFSGILDAPVPIGVPLVCVIVVSIFLFKRHDHIRKEYDFLLKGYRTRIEELNETIRAREDRIEKLETSLDNYKSKEIS